MSYRKCLPLLALLALVAGPALADSADRTLLASAFSRAGLTSDIARDRAELLDEMIEIIADAYVEPKDHAELTKVAAKAVEALPAPKPAEDALHAATAALTEALDPHTAYLTPSDMDDMKTSISGQFGGVGMELTQKDGKVVVVAPIDDTPASRAGVKVDDRIVRVDGKTVEGLTLMQVVAKIRGKVGTKVTLTMARGTEPEREVSLRREVIHLRPVKGRLEGTDVAYVRISQFAGGTAQSLKSTLYELDKAAGGKLKGIVLDLRRNPGGLLDQGIAVADLFLGDVTIVSTNGRRSADRQTYSGRAGEILAGTPMAVLIDGGSASASEIVAGALEDNRRATLIGQKSYGKGSVQTILPLSEGGLRVTTAHYLRPSGKMVDKVGIIPAVAVEPAEQGDPQLDRALAVVRGR